jgi:hypothetical protein
MNRNNGENWIISSHIGHIVRRGRAWASKSMKKRCATSAGRVSSSPILRRIGIRRLAERRRSTTVFTLALIVLAFPCIEFTALAQETEAERDAKNNTVQDAPPPSCHVTLPSAESARLSYVPEPGRGGYVMVGTYGTENLSVLLPTDGIWWGLPSKPGDFAYFNKFPWRGTFSYTDGAGPLIVTGKRLDGLAPSFTEIQPITGKHWMMGGVSIPVFGCWEITGRYKDQELTFIVWVMPAPQKEDSAGASSPQAAITSL